MEVLEPSASTAFAAERVRTSSELCMAYVARCAWGRDGAYM